jgi:hypothetical protein
VDDPLAPLGVSFTPLLILIFCNFQNEFNFIFFYRYRSPKRRKHIDIYFIKELLTELKLALLKQKKLISNFHTSILDAIIFS